MFRDRVDAGRQLAQRLEFLRGQRAVVLGLPRGGVPVAYEVALELDVPLDVLVVRKLGLPGQPELAMGAVGEDGVTVLNEEVLRQTGIGERALNAVRDEQAERVERLAVALRQDQPKVPLAGRCAVIVDDGVATGSTARAACRIARVQGAASVVLAVPVAPPTTPADLGTDADQVVCVRTPEDLRAVGQWYADFSQVTDDEVARLLRAAAGRT